MEVSEQRPAATALEKGNIVARVNIRFHSTCRPPSAPALGLRPSINAPLGIHIGRLASDIYSKKLSIVKLRAFDPYPELQGLRCLSDSFFA